MKVISWQMLFKFATFFSDFAIGASLGRAS